MWMPCIGAGDWSCLECTWQLFLTKPSAQICEREVQKEILANSLWFRAHVGAGRTLSWACSILLFLACSFERVYWKCTFCSSGKRFSKTVNLKACSFWDSFSTLFWTRDKLKFRESLILDLRGLENLTCRLYSSGSS